MRKCHICGVVLLGVFFIRVVPACADSATWISVMGVALAKDDFSTLVCSPQVRSVTWPAVYSSNAAARLSVESPGTAETNASLYALATAFCRQLEGYAPLLDGMNDTTLAERASHLLEIRGSVQAGDGMVNVLVSDAISRVLFVTLATRFGIQPEHSDLMYDNIASALSGACDIHWILDVLAVENDWPTSTVARLKALDTGATVRDMSDEVGATIEAVLAPYGAMQHVGLYRLMAQNSPSRVLCLHRSVKTQTLLRVLQLGGDYKRDAEEFALDHAAEEIDAVLPRARSRYAYTLVPTGMVRSGVPPFDTSGWCVEEHLSKARFTGRDVEVLFDLIDGGPLRAQRLFSYPPQDGI